ncbi:erythromycin esterase family protein [Pararhodonellum marinum]|uniref:erythromycin esterase family protein n=1 Tax=Pararhodonellum marinum TaxID=2755358 RepID=UPI00188FCE7D|nr:erythromycin esterase family protein [Pararhodonellum marinum]
MKTYQKAIAIILSILVICWLVYRLLIIDFLFPINKDLAIFISEHTVEIASIDPMDPTMVGFEHIAQAIGDSRVVFLGEQDHGEAPTFLAKTKLIQYLHQNMGFDVVVFESDFFALNFNSSDSLIGHRTDFQENIYSIWSKCLECQDLFEYIEASRTQEKPILIAGADPRHSMVNSEKWLVPSFMKYMDDVNLFESGEEKEIVREVLHELLEREYNSEVNERDKDTFMGFLDKAEIHLDDSIFWYQETRNLRGFFYNTFSDSNNERDVQMADNLLWLLKHPFRDRKVVFWGSNSHIFKNYTTLIEKYGPKISNDSTNMGSEVAKWLGNDLYIMGFTSLQGEGGRLYQESYEIGLPDPNHFEALIHQKDFDYAFIDFQKNPNELENIGHFWMKTLVHQPNYYAWHKMFDGIFYIKDTYRCTAVPKP